MLSRGLAKKLIIIVIPLLLFSFVMVFGYLRQYKYSKNNLSYRQLAAEDVFFKKNLLALTPSWADRISYSASVSGLPQEISFHDADDPEKYLSLIAKHDFRLTSARIIGKTDQYLVQTPHAGLQRISNGFVKNATIDLNRKRYAVSIVHDGDKKFFHITLIEIVHPEESL